MANNVSYTYTHLHTKSSYMGQWVPSLKGEGTPGDDLYMQQLQKAIDSLKSKEDAFANKFGYDNLEDLMKAIHNLFTGDFKNDLKVLERFQSDNLRAALHQKFDNNSFLLDGKQVRLVLETNKTEQDLEKIKQNLEKALGFTFKSGDFTITSKVENINQVTIGLDWNVPNVKRIVNAIQSKHFVYNTTDSKGRDISSKSQADYRLVEYFKTNAAAMVTIKSTKTGKPHPYEFRSSPLAYKGKELPNLSKQEALKIESLINNFIFNELAAGASNDMQTAIKITWNNIMKKRGLQFFLGGEGWVNHLIGALGEFITPAFFYYCAARLPNSKGFITEFMSLVGQDLNRFSEQKSIDIEIAFLKNAGIQVKNYNGAFVKDAAHQDTSKQRTVDVNLHPSDISSLVHDERIVPYITNSYFNTSIAQIPIEELESFFKYHAYEFLNLSIDDSQIEDRATFYLIGGYFIPGSAILEAAFIQRTIEVSNTSIKLKGNADQANDMIYNGYIDNHPVFLHWWTGNQYIGWTPTSNNDLTAYEANILINTRFTFSALFKENYKIF